MNGQDLGSEALAAHPSDRARANMLRLAIKFPDGSPKTAEMARAQVDEIMRDRTLDLSTFFSDELAEFHFGPQVLFNEPRRMMLLFIIQRAHEAADPSDAQTRKDLEDFAQDFLDVADEESQG